MASRWFQTIVSGTNIVFAVKSLRSVSRKWTKEWIATVRDLCIDFDIGGQANLATIPVSDTILAPSAVILKLPGKYQVLLRTDCKTLGLQENRPKLPAVTTGSAPFWTNGKGVLRSPGFRDYRYNSAYPLTVKYTTDTTWTPSNFRLDIAAANAVLLPCSIPSRKRSGKPKNSARGWARFAQQFPHERDAAIGRSLGAGSISIGTLSRCLRFDSRFEIPAALCQTCSRTTAVEAQRLLLGADLDFTDSIRTNNAAT